MATPPQYASQAPSSLAKPSEPIRNKKYDPKKPHITEEPITKSNWYKHVNWLNVTLIVGVPVYGLIAAYWTPLQWKTAVWAVAYYFMTGLGITAGMFTLLRKVSSVRTNNFCRLPQTLGTHVVLCNTAFEDFPRCRWRWRR
jgi:stearoyl-CoA desaturase (delta-9 desaturase)